MSRAPVRPGPALLVAGLLAVLPQITSAQDIASEYRASADRIIEAATSSHFAYERLGELVDRFGARFSGTVALEEALDWILDEMRADGLDNVQSDMVMVPHWVRGEESARMVRPRPRELPMLGLGGSIGTPEGGITAEVLVVSSFEELESRADEARGRIVLFDVPFTGYGPTVQYRSRGAVAAARAGAVASLIRSVGPESMQSPHTGGMGYDDSVEKIPHVDPHPFAEPAQGQVVGSQSRTLSLDREPDSLIVGMSLA